MSNIIQGKFGMSEKENKEVVCCSMCGQKAAEGVPIISNQTIHICGNCIKDSYDLIKDDIVPRVDTEFKKKTPSMIVEFVNQYVIGQDAAKKTLALAIYNHYKRINNPIHNDVELQKSNILMIGPSGTGKTHLIKSIAKFLDIPFAIADATTLTEAGYVGEDVESMLQQLIQAADGDVEKAKYGIILVDEIDKIAKKSSGASLTKDPSGEGVQQALLKMIEGTESRVLKSGSRKTAKDAMDTIDTSHILFVCCGAFVGLDEIVKRNHSTTSLGMGFGATIEKSDEEHHKPEPEDLYEFGLIPELVGRLPVISVLNDLTVNDLQRVLTEPKDSITKQFQALVEMDGAKLEFTESAIKKIAELASERKTGARGLRSIVENTLNDVMFELPDREDVKELIVDVAEDTLITKML